jgi:polysaccharide chain length determinant protein (PEP-CTERM system associated)
MHEILDQVIEQLRGAWRFRWIAMLVAWIVCLIGWLVVFTLPDMYQATARVYVDTRTALQPLLEGLAVRSDVDSQLNMVRQAMLGGPQLERVARETDLDVRAETPQDRAELIDALRQRITIQGGNQTGNPNESGGLYVISYQDPSHAKSVEVVDKLLNSFMEDTLGSKREGSENAQRFLRDQIQDYERRLSEAEQRLAAFKKRNVGMMPGEHGDYFSRLQSEMDAITKAQANLRVATSRREELLRQLRGETPFVASGGAAAGAGTNNSTGTAGQIKDTQARLDDMLLRFTERHPDVIALQETLAQLKQRHQEEIRALQRGDSSVAATTGASANPVYQSIQLTLNQTEVEIAALRGTINDGQRKVAQLRELVDTVPEVEAEFARLNRDYDVTKAQYNALVDRFEKARLTDQAAETGIVKFQVIDPPAAPFSPAAPQRPLLLAAVLIVGLAAGGGLAFFLHLLRPVFNNARSLNEITGFPVLGAISMTWLDKRQRQERVRKLAFGGAGAALVVVFGIVLAFQQDGARFMGRLIG